LTCRPVFGPIIHRRGYDARGKRRFPNGADDPIDTITGKTRRGFTGQEVLARFGLDHLDGRVYDPLIARMIGAGLNPPRTGLPTSSANLLEKSDR